jgi:DNA segregation ATPase FtsK/SpoIIIE, S-DNA-T family
MGKTALVRLLGLGVGLDPRVELHVLNCKGGADFLVLRPICHTYLSSARSESRPPMLADLLSVKREMERRYDAVEALAEKDPVRCPEGKITDELASDKSLGLHPIVILCDEAHMAFADETVGKQLSAVAEDLARRGPAALIIFVLASQRTDKGSIPVGISATAQMRFCMRVASHTEADLILGTAAHKRGAVAEQLGRTDYGIGYLTGEAGVPQLVRTSYIDLVDAAPIVARALAARTAAGRLTGMAAGEIPEAVEDTTTNISDHALTVWPAGRVSLWWDELAELLAARYPGAYDAWTGRQVSAAMAEVKGVNVKRRIDGKEITRRGPRHTDIIRAAGDRALAQAMTDNETETGDDTDNEAGDEGY